MSPQRIWKPTKRQADFLSLPDEIFEALYGGAAGGGKTDTLLSIPYAKEDKYGKPLYTNPKFKMLFLRRTFPELDGEVVPRTKGTGNIVPYESLGFKPYNESKKRWTHECGSVVQFGHCEHKEDVRKYDTSEYNVIAYDEATSFDPFQYEYLTFSRCRSSCSSLPAYVRGGTNPGNIAHSYFRTRFVQPAKDGNVVLRETRKIHGTMQTCLRIFIPSKAQDNEYLLKNDPDYINRIQRMPEAERKAKADGDWWTFSGQVFEDFRTIPFPDEPLNAVHVIEPFAIPSYWPRLLAIDWGYSAMMCAGWYAINPIPSKKYPAKIYKYREYTCVKTKISIWAADVARISREDGGLEGYIDFVLDPSAWQERGDPSTIAEQVATHLGRQPRKAYNGRVGGKLVMQELIRWRPKPSRYVPQTGYDQELADKIRRMQGPKAFEEYFKLFQPEEEEPFLPKFQIFNCCTKTIETLPVCVYDKNNPEDVAEFDGDDPYDETRYGLCAAQNYLDTGQVEAQSIDKRAGICSKYESGEISTNTFYMQMGNLDAKGVKASRGVKRYHGSRLPFANF